MTKIYKYTKVSFNRKVVGSVLQMFLKHYKIYIDIIVKALSHIFLQLVFLNLNIISISIIEKKNLKISNIFSKIWLSQSYGANVMTKMEEISWDK